jgi:hypothetical protein
MKAAGLPEAEKSKIHTSFCLFYEKHEVGWIYVAFQGTHKVYT